MPGIHPAIAGGKDSTMLLAILAAGCMCITGSMMTFAADTESVLTSFSGKGGANSQAGVIFDASGNLYGTTSGGGSSNCVAIKGCGTVFELSPGVNGTWTKKILHYFNGSDGAYPFGALVFDGAGNLYGITSWGGSSGCVQGAFFGCGTVFQLSPGANGAWTLNVLHRFSGTTDGANPACTLIFDAAGNLYGTTTAGAGKYGTVFRMHQAVNGSWGMKILHTFNNTDGASPYGSLVFDASGNLYGTSRTGGTSNTGTVFQLSLAGGGNWTETVLYSFKSSDGTFPEAGLVLDGAGNLYGTTSSSGGTCGCAYGTAFELVRGTGGTWTKTTLHTFTTTDGHAPFGLVFDAAGLNLYGVTFVGGTANDGTVFELSLGSGGKWVETQLHLFVGTDGAGPVGSLIFDSSGNLYGASAYGGTVNEGTVFKLSTGADSR